MASVMGSKKTTENECDQPRSQGFSLDNMEGTNYHGKTLETRWEGAGVPSGSPTITLQTSEKPRWAVKCGRISFLAVTSSLQLLKMRSYRRTGRPLPPGTSYFIGS